MLNNYIKYMLNNYKYQNTCEILINIKYILNIY